MRAGPAMSVRVSLLRTAGFVSLFLLIDILSRFPLAEYSGMHDVWPAVGAATLWLVAQRQAPVRWIDPVVLVAATVGVNLAAGQTAAVAAVLGLVVLVQVGTFLWLLT